MAVTPSSGVWICPGCERRVPRREPRCHCGAARLELTANPIEGEAAATTPVLVTLLAALVALLLLVVATRSSRPVPASAPRAPGAAGTRPAVFPPLPPLPDEGE